MCYRVSRKMLNMADSVIRTHQLLNPNRVDTRHMYYTSHQRLQNPCAQMRVNMRVNKTYGNGKKSRITGPKVQLLLVLMYKRYPSSSIN